VIEAAYEETRESVLATPFLTGMGGSVPNSAAG
jgi:hypothetical protein